MLKDLIKTAAAEANLTQVKARKAVGIILNAAERQGSEASKVLFQRLPGARTLSARTGSDLGAATGVIARLIEQTPGGQRHVAETMLSDLHEMGLGHKQIGQLFGALSLYADKTYGIKGFGHLGDILGGQAAIARDRFAA